MIDFMLFNVCIILTGKSAEQITYHTHYSTPAMKVWSGWGWFSLFSYHQSDQVIQGGGKKGLHTESQE